MWIYRKIDNDSTQITFLKWRDIHHLFRKYAASFVIPEAHAVWLPNPCKRTIDCVVGSANGVSLRAWFKDHGRGRFKVEFTKPPGDDCLVFTADMTVQFSDKKTAMLAKLTWGGR